MKELKSAFEIEGFMEGKTWITTKQEVTAFGVNETGVLVFKSLESENAEEYRADMPFNDLQFGKWYPVEQKKKYWRHVYIVAMPDGMLKCSELVIYTEDDWEKYEGNSGRIQIESRQVEI